MAPRSCLNNIYLYLLNLCNEFTMHLAYSCNQRIWMLNGLPAFGDVDHILLFLSINFRFPDLAFVQWHNDYSYNFMNTAGMCIRKNTHTHTQKKEKTYWRMLHPWLHFPLLYALDAQHAWTLKEYSVSGYSLVIPEINYNMEEKYVLYLTWSNEPREEYGGEGCEVLPGKSWRRHHHLDLPNIMNVVNTS